MAEKRKIKRGVNRTIRRTSAMDAMVVQLKSGVKTKKGTHDEKIPLTDKDVKRLETEIGILKERI